GPGLYWGWHSTHSPPPPPRAPGSTLRRAFRGWGGSTALPLSESGLMTGIGPDRRVGETRSRSNNIGCQAAKISRSVVASEWMGTILIIVALSLSGLGAPAYGSSLLRAAATLPDPTDEAALRNLAHEFLASYASGDLVRFMSLWTPDSPELAERRDKARQF